LHGAKDPCLQPHSYIIGKKSTKADVPLINVNMQMSFLSPPFGYALFYLKGVAPLDISMEDIIKAALPFLGLQFIGMVICIIFPIICLYLPGLMFVGFGK